MKKKIVSAVMAASLAVLTAFPVLAGNGVFTIKRSYTAGYQVPNSNFFFTGTLLKNSNQEWVYAEDSNIETLFVDGNGLNQLGNHWTCVFFGDLIISAEKKVYSGQRKRFDYFYGNYSMDADNIRLKISNGDSRFLYKTKGSFIAVKGDPNI